MQLIPDHCKRIRLAGRSQQFQQIVITSVFRDQCDVFTNTVRFQFRQCGKDHAEDPAFSQTAADVTGVKEDFHGKIPVIRPGFDEAADNFLIACAAQRSNGCKQVYAL